MFKPEYFIENQAGGVNQHDSLQPAMSTLVIIAHVKDGAIYCDKLSEVRCLFNYTIATYRGLPPASDIQPFKDLCKWLCKAKFFVNCFGKENAPPDVHWAIDKVQRHIKTEKRVLGIK